LVWLENKRQIKGSTHTHQFLQSFERWSHSTSDGWCLFDHCTSRIVGSCYFADLCWLSNC